MRFDPQAGAFSSPDQTSPGTRRRSGRLPQDTLRCNLGPVLDLSVGGMRIHCRRVPDRPVEITLDGYTLPEQLVAVPTWSKRVGLFSNEVGLRFENLSPKLAQALTQIAGANRFRRAI